MFADNMLLFISQPIISLSNITTVIEQFGSFAGFKVNYSKSTLFPLTQDLGIFSSHPILTSFALCTSNLKYLGIYIPQKLSSLYQVNYKPIIKAIGHSLTNCKGLPLSLSGRIAVIKSVLFPKL